MAGVLSDAFSRRSRLFLFGNGGAAALSQHIAAEFVGRYRYERRPFAALSLTSDAAVLTALANDFGYEQVFARQLRALARPGDVALALSTSGTAPSVLAGVEAATILGLHTIAITGSHDNPLRRAVDVALVVESREVSEIQEGMLSAAHAICAHVEEELAAARVVGRAPRRSPKISTFETLLELRLRWRRAGMRVVWTNGCFDLLHMGHVRMLEAAAALGDVLVVGLNTDESVRLLKGPGRPVVELGDRAELVASLAAVDRVVAFHQPTPEELLRALQPEVFCKGADYVLDELPERSIVEAYGGTIELLPYLPGRSTTALTETISSAR